MNTQISTVPARDPPVEPRSLNEVGIYTVRIQYTGTPATESGRIWAGGATGQGQLYRQSIHRACVPVSAVAKTTAGRGKAPRPVIDTIARAVARVSGSTVQ